MDIMFVRLSIASAGLLVLILFMEHSFKSLKVERKDILLFILFGIFKFLSDYTFIHSLDNINVCLATLLQNTAPYFVMLLSYFIFKEKVSRKVLLIVMMGTFGCVLMSGMALLKTTLEPMGILSALASALCMGVYYIGNRLSKEKGYRPAAFTFYLLFISALITLPFINVGGIGSALSDMSILIRALALGIVVTLIPYYVVAWSIQHINPIIVAVICVSEVLFAAVTGALYFDEALDIQDFIGIVLLVASIVLISRQSELEKKDTESSE